MTNCTYDGVCYNAKEAQDLLEKPPIVCTLTKPGTAMHVSTRSMPITMPCAANLGDHNGPTVFATHSTHKLLNALSQASYIHVREGRGAINFSRFNQPT